MTPRAANHIVHSQPPHFFWSNGQPSIVAFPTQEHFCEQRNRDNATYRLIARVSRAWICNAREYNRVAS